MQTVDTLIQATGHPSAEEFQTIATSAERGRECYGQERKNRQVWLLNNEIFALDGLGRFDEAETLVDFFYERYATDTTIDRSFLQDYRARLMLWRLRFRAIEGDLMRAVLAYAAATPYIGSLPRERQAHMRLDLAYLYGHENLHLDALPLVQQVESDLRGADRADPKLRRAYARALMRLADHFAKLAGGGDRQYIAQLDSAALLAQQAVDIFREDQVLDRLCQSLTILATVHVTKGEVPLGFTYFDQAVELARLNDLDREVISAYRLRGYAYHRLEKYAEAEQDYLLARAMVEETGHREIEPRILLGLGKAKEAQGDISGARAVYQTLLDKTKSSDYFEDSWAADSARAGLLRVGLEATGSTLPLPWMLLALAVALIFYLLDRNRRLKQPNQSNPQSSRLPIGTSVQPPVPSPADPQPKGDEIQPGEDPFAAIIQEYSIDDKERLVGRVYAIYRARREPLVVAREIFDRDPYMAERLERDAIRSNNDLFRIVAALEGYADDDDDPAGKIKSYLLKEFTNRDIPWPRSPGAWDRFFRL